MDERDDSGANHHELSGARVELALRDTEVALPSSVRSSRRRPHLAPYRIPALVIGDDSRGPSSRAPSSRLRNRSRDHAMYLPPHAPRRSFPPQESLPTQRIVRMGHVRQQSASTIVFFTLVALTVVAMGVAALAYVHPEKHGSAQAELALVD